MNEEQFNLDLRKFLKRFGVTAQREIEKTVREAVEAGTLSGTTVLRVRAKLELDGTDLEVVIEEDLRLE